MDLKNMRLNYEKSSIDFNNLFDNPFSFFSLWMNDAINVVKEANAFVLSTVSNNNIPSSRVVLLKHFDQNGFVFYTNYQSDKSIDISNNKFVSLNFYWPNLERQVRISGKANRISAEKSDTYFKSRPKESKIGALLSHQSEEIDLNYDFSERFQKIKDSLKNSEIKRPDNWGGIIIKPNFFEFWQGKPSRLHDRICYKIKENKWILYRLAP